MATEPVPESKSSFFSDYANIVKISAYCVFGIILTISLAVNAVLFSDSQDFTWRMASMKEKIRAAVVVACGVDIKKDPKSVTFTKEENSDGEEFTVLKCVKK